MELYSNEPKDEVVAKGEYGGQPYIIRTLGYWPCAYIGLVHEPSFDVDELEVPVCFTYKSWEMGRMECMDPDWKWLGWDYGHACDYIPKFNPDGHKYTIEEIEKDIKEVIRAYKKKCLENI